MDILNARAAHPAELPTTAPRIVARAFCAASGVDLGTAEREGTNHVCVRGHDGQLRNYRAGTVHLLRQVLPPPARDAAA